METPLDEKLIAMATRNIRDILALSLLHDPHEPALVIYDTNYGLTKILTAAYRKTLPHARFIDFNSMEKDTLIAAMNEMHERALVVLIQSSSFLLNEFRIRLHLFNKKLKVIEHVHLHRNTEDVWDVYIDSLAYDPPWLHTVGPKLKEVLMMGDALAISGGDALLTITGKLEEPKLNIGDYRTMQNIGGTFPIGEVFTEVKDFATMNGSTLIYAFADDTFTVKMYEPFRIDIREGLVVGWENKAPETFVRIINKIKEYERPLVREIGFGLNRAITRERYPQDITAFERLVGLHYSLGEKHSVYKKRGINAAKSKFHIDIFPVVDRVTVNDQVIFEGDTYLPTPATSQRTNTAYCI